MLNWFSSKKINELNNEQDIKRFIEEAFTGLNTRINTSQKLYDFVIEEICGAAQGNSTAQELVKFSSLHLVEYEHALNNDSTMDEKDSASDYLTNNISQQLIKELGLDHAINIRCHILKSFIQLHKDELDKIRLKIAEHKIATADQRHIYFRKENEWLNVILALTRACPEKKPALEAKTITNIISRNNDTHNGAFFNLYKDIEDHFTENEEISSEILMPILYALRISFAGMYAQGIVTKDIFDACNQDFFNHMARIGETITKEQQVKFQEESLDKAIELINKNYQKFERHTSHLFVAAAKQGISLREALKSAINAWEQDNFSEHLELNVLNSEFCTLFYTVGGWLPEEDYKQLAKKAYNFLYNETFAPYTLLLRNKI